MTKPAPSTLVALLSATALTGLPSAAAQDTVSEPVSARADVDEIVVTGSRIARDPNLASPVPVQSLGEEAFRLTGDIGVADIVNDIPALISSTAPEASGSAGTGASALNLRGLGTARTLTLVNGRRHVAGFEGTQAVDVGSIPVALIDRVEVLTGGASAVYGSDAVTGVVNFVLKEDYEGLDLDLSGGISDEGDAERFAFRGLVGKNFLDDRLNVTLGVDVIEDTALRFGDRDFTRDNLRSRSLPNPALRFQRGDITDATPSFAAFYNLDTTGRYPFGFRIPDAEGFLDAYEAAFGARPTLTEAERALIDRAATASARAILPRPTFSISSNAGVIAGANFDFADGVDVNGNGIDDCRESFVGFNSTLTGTGSFGLAGGCWTTTQGGGVRVYQDGLVAGDFNQFGGDGIRDDFDADFLYPETDSAVVNLNSRFEFLPGHTAFFEGKLSRSTSRYGGPLNTFYDLLYGAPDNPFLPEALQGLADEQGGLYITRDPTDLGPNEDETERKVWRIVAGVEGDLGEGWTYEVALNEAKFEREITDNNFVLLDRFFAAIDVVEGPDGQPVCRSSVSDDLYPTTIFGIPAFDPGYYTFSPGDGSCAPANIWGGPDSISAEAVDFITTTVRDELSLRQTVYSAIVVGDTGGFELPGGPIGLAFGTEFRREESENLVNDFDRGVLPEGTTFTPGQLVSEVSDNGSLGFNAEAAVLNSRGQYDVLDGFVEATAPVLRDVPGATGLTFDAAFRYAHYSTIGGAETWKVGATWAPVPDISFRGTISQAIRAPNIDELFGPQNPATFRPIDPCDADELVNAPDRAVRERNCAALGLPEGFRDPLSARFLGSVGGNPNLEEETADTYTIGFVFEPRFADGLVLTADYWNVDITDAISTIAAQDIVDLCVDDPGGIDNQFCALIGRNDDPNSPQFGGFNDLSVAPLNFAALEAAGVDFSASYSRSVGAHDFGLNVAGTYQDKLDRFSDPDDPSQVDPELGEVRRPRWAGNAALSYGWRDLSAVLTLRYQSKQAVDGVDIRNADIEDVLDGDGVLISEGFGGLGFGGARARFGDNAIADETYILDLSATYDVADDISVYGGVQNLTDEEPFATNEGFPVSARGRYVFAGVRLVR